MHEIRTEKKPEIITRIERRFLHTIVFIVVFVSSMAIIDTIFLLYILTYEQRITIMLPLIFFEAMVTAILIVHGSFLKERVEYEVVSETKTCYGSERKMRRIEKGERK